jgi:demethylmenaquinone methyltransferase/2-methoxy-6-polyprenyl-1,4-benzoquinol methylase
MTVPEKYSPDDGNPELFTGEGICRAQKVRAMFGAIAGRYDFLNHFLSANLDRGWRRACVREVSRQLKVASPKILDIGCGTADLSIAFSDTGHVTGCDFCHEMLVLGARKAVGRRAKFPVNLLEADALALPFPDETFDVAVSAFVLRNLADMRRGLDEMRRVLRPGGVLGILDFGMPRLPLVRQAYSFYFLKILPRVGQWISGSDGPYQYLPSSVQNFPSIEELQKKAGDAGFLNIRIRRLTAGIAVLLTGVR